MPTLLQRSGVSFDLGSRSETPATPARSAAASPSTSGPPPKTITKMFSSLQETFKTTRSRTKSIKDTKAPKPDEESPQLRSKPSSSHFLTPSLSAGSISSPALHRSSDPTSRDTPAAQISPVNSVAALTSPPRRRATVTSKDQTPSTPTKKYPPTATPSSSRPVPTPPTFSLSSSKKKLTSPSSPTLISHPDDPNSQTTPVRRPAIRQSLDEDNRERSSSSLSRERSSSRSPSPTATRRKLTSPIDIPSTPTRRRPSLDQQHRARPSIGYTSASTSHLPSSPPPTPLHRRRDSTERHVPSPVLNGSPSPLYKRRNSSSTSFSNVARSGSPISNSGSRAMSPVYRGHTHARTGSSASLVGGGISRERELIRQAASFVVKEMAHPPIPQATTSQQNSCGGLAGASAGVQVNPWEEVEYRLAKLIRVERVWNKSGSSGGGSVFGTIGMNGSSVTLNAESYGTTAGGGNEEKERNIFCEALRDGYVLAQLINKLHPADPLPIPIVNPRQDEKARSQNISKFRDSAKAIILKSLVDHLDQNPPSLEMFGLDALVETTPESVAKVARVILMVAAIKQEGTAKKWLAKEKEKERQREASMNWSGSGSGSGGRTSNEMERRASIRSPYGPNHGASESTSNLMPRSPTTQRFSPTPTTTPRKTINGEVGMLSERRPSLEYRRSSGSRSPALSPPSSPPPAPSARIMERRGSNTGMPPPAKPPRSHLRHSATSSSALSLPPNRVSVASSAQTQATDHTNLFETNRNSNRFGTFKSTSTDLTEPDGSWGREDAVVAMKLHNALEAEAAPSSSLTSSSKPISHLAPNGRRRSYDMKAQSGGLGIGYPSGNSTTSLSGELYHPQEGAVTSGLGAISKRRRSSEIAASNADLTRVVEESTDLDASSSFVKEKNRGVRAKRSSDSDDGGGDGQKSSFVRDPSQDSSAPSTATSATPKPKINLGKGKFPDDFINIQLVKSSGTNKSSRPPGAAPPAIPSTPLPAREPSSKSESTTPPLTGSVDLDRTPTARAPRPSSSKPITIVTAASRDNTPRDEMDSMVFSSSPVGPPLQPAQLEYLGIQQFRKPTHKAGSKSVDGLLSRRSSERRPLGERRASVERNYSHLAQESSSSNSGDSFNGDSTKGSSGLNPVPAAIPRPMQRRLSSRDNARHGIYIPRQSSAEDRVVTPINTSSGISDSSIIPMATSVPALSSVRVPFPRSSSGEYKGEPLSPKVPNPIDQPRPGLAPKDEVGGLPPTPRRASFTRQRIQSDLENPRIIRRKSGTTTSSAVGPIPINRTNSIVGSSAQGEDNESAISGLQRRSRIESLMGMSSAASSSTNLTRAQSMAGLNARQTIVVKEDGKTIHYQLGNFLGKGQFGTVYRALNLNTGQMVAVKRIGLEGLPENEVDQLMKEVELLRTLSHPSIVKYEGMVRDKDNLNIVLEYVEGGSLGQVLKSFGQLNESLVASYVTKILEGLHYLHEQHVVHRDLKAANILNTKNGNIKLSDFGVSLNINTVGTMQDNVAGTPNWMAPEIIELKGAVPASDIWSLGCTVVELLTGRPPYAEIRNSVSVMWKIVTEDSPPLPEGCSEELQDFLNSCFQKDPAKRPSADVLFEHPWLKQSWGLLKELRPQDSVPFLRRVSVDLQKVDIARFSQQNFSRDEFTSETPPIPPTTELPPSEPEFITRPHSFVKTTFSKPVMCRICREFVKKGQVLCEDCGLICHVRCVHEASPSCDGRAQFRPYTQKAVSNNSGSPALTNGTSLPSPVPASPQSPDHILSSSPSIPKFLGRWRKNSHATTPEVVPNPLPVDDATAKRGIQFPRSRPSDDNLNSRASVHSSHRSSSMHSAHTRNSMASVEVNGSVVNFHQNALADSVTQQPEATRGRRRRNSSMHSKNDCVIQ
ncbi:hypothetical protein FRC03_010981 [Tulasnella sp. 419]|nr:hypothetical protein FRC03_010981 [Tulasnella sp. 419]